jgi:hypothetical protein
MAAPYITLSIKAADLAISRGFILSIYGIDHHRALQI